MDAKRYTLISYTLISSRSVCRKFSWIRTDVLMCLCKVLWYRVQKYATRPLLAIAAKHYFYCTPARFSSAIVASCNCRLLNLKPEVFDADFFVRSLSYKIKSDRHLMAGRGGAES